MTSVQRMKCFSLPAVLLSVLAGCASLPEDSRPQAVDSVCLYNRDLGCVRLRVDSTTPRAVYKGTTYYFCADACREDFEREPGKYVSALLASKYGQAP